MIKVTLGNNLKKETVIVDENTTTLHLDGATLRPGDLDKTFGELGIKEKCFLLNVVKADNA